MPGYLRGPSFLSGLEGSGEVEVRPDGRSEDGVWVTFGRNSAVRYDLGDMSVKSVINVPSHLGLSCPIGHDADLDTDVAIVDNKTLLAFNSSTDESSAINEHVNLDQLLKDKGHALPTGVKAVDLICGLNGGLYVLFDDGQLQSVRYLMKSSDQDNAGDSITSSSPIYPKVHERSQKLRCLIKTFPKAQRTQGIENFDI